MSDVTAAMDEDAVTQVLGVAQASLGTLTNTGSSTFGPFTATYGASGSFSGAVAHLFTPDVVQISGCKLSYAVGFKLSFDLSNIIPDLHFPGFTWSFTIKFWKWTKTITISIPGWTYNWPTVTIPVSYSDSLKFTANYKLATQYVPPHWHVDAVVLALPQLQITVAAAAILVLIGAAAAAVLVSVPFIGLFLAGAVLGITTTLGVAGVLNLLGAMLTPFIAGTKFPLYRHPRPLQVLPPAGPFDPAVFVQIASVSAAVVHSGEPELVLSANITP